VSGQSWVGIDPGMDGYLVVLTVEDEVTFFAVPTLKTGKGNRRAYDVPALFRGLSEHVPGAKFTLLEKQQAMKGQGVTSCFTTGFGYGLWRMGLVALSAPYEEVRPGLWKKAMGITVQGGKNANERKKIAKARAIEKAQQLYPRAELVPPRCRVPSHDRAEALLLAHYARAKSTGRPL